jgi:hypothetical protein
MKIDEDKFPSLFAKGLYVKNPFNSDEFNSLMADTVDIAKQFLHYTTRPIMEAISKSFEKLLPLVDELPENSRGICFSQKDNEGYVVHSVLLYAIVRKNGFIHVMGQVHSKADGAGQYGELFHAEVHKSDRPGILDLYLQCHVKHDKPIQDAVKIILSTELFLHFAEIETKVVNPNRQIWDGPTCLYNNKTKMPITVVDSKWFTTLIISGAFNVSGHFRLQPCGEGLKDRKLIWISDFQKNGYIRKAKIEVQDELPTH